MPSAEMASLLSALGSALIVKQLWDGHCERTAAPYDTLRLEIWLQRLQELGMCRFDCADGSEERSLTLAG